MKFLKFDIDFFILWNFTLKFISASFEIWQFGES